MIDRLLESRLIRSPWTYAITSVWFATGLWIDKGWPLRLSNVVIIAGDWFIVGGLWMERRL